MRPSSFVLTPATRFLLPLALIATTYLYLYPFFQRCAFPRVPSHTPDGNADFATAPFRLLALADPQLEGSSSVPVADLDLRARWAERRWEGVLEGLGRLGRKYHKLLDLWGNDLYLAHIYRTMHWWAQPTHVVVLGDMLGSQWIDGAEFERRQQRFWNVVMRGAERVSEAVMDAERRVEVLGEEKKWERRVIAVAGNHDVGYAGDMTRERTERFEAAFGRVNWEIRFSLNQSDGIALTGDGLEFVGGDAMEAPQLRLIVLNSMNLDSPAWDKSLQRDSQDFLRTRLLDRAIPTSTGTVLLTHIPLYKKEPVCTDKEYFSYFPILQGGGIREQNFLSQQVSQHILDSLIGPHGDRQAIVLNGHDHAGCDTFRSPAPPGLMEDPSELTSDSEAEWAASRYRSWHDDILRKHTDVVGLREITVQSMMGDFGGNAGLLSAWWDGAAGRWEFDYASCTAGVQHFWWAVHVVDLVTLGLVLTGLGLQRLEEGVLSRRRGKVKGE